MHALVHIKPIYYENITGLHMLYGHAYIYNKNNYNYIPLLLTTPKYI